MTDGEMETGRFRGQVETKLTYHEKRITRIEVAMIAVVVYLASRSAEKLFALLP